MNVSIWTNRLPLVTAVLALAAVGPARGADISWTTGSGDWDTTTANWTGGSTLYTDGDNVSFTQGSAGPRTITLVGSLLPGSVTVNSSQTYNFNGTGTIADTTVTKSGSGELSLLTGVFGSNVNLAVNAGTFRISSISTTGTTLRELSGAGGTIAYAGKTLTVGGGNTDTTYSGAWNGSGTLIKTGTGVLTLGGTTNDFAGSLTINGGTVRLGVSGKLPFATNPNVNSGGTLDLNGFNQSLSVLNMQGGSTVLTGAGTLSIGSALRPFSGISGGTGTVAQLTGNVNFTSATRIDLDIRTNASSAAITQVFDGVISGASGGIGTTGNTAAAAVLRLSGSASNTFTGPWTYGRGTIQLNKTGGAIAIPTNVTISDGGTLVWQGGSEQIADSASLTIGGGGMNLAGFTETVRNLASPGTGQFTPNSAGKLILAGNVTNLIDIGTGSNISKEVGIDIDLTGTGGILFTTTANQNRTMQIGTATAGQRTLDFGTSTRTVTVTGAGTLAVSALISSQITGSGGLIKDGTSLLRLSANNTFTGDTRVDAGTLDLNGNASAITKSAFNTSGAGTLTNISNTPTFGGLLGSNGFALGGTVTTLTLDVAAGATKTLAGVLSGGAGSLNVRKTGAGTQVFGGVNSHSGTTSVLGGRLEVASSGNLAAGGVTINGATADLRWNSSTSLTSPLTFTAGTISGTGTIGVAVNVGSGRAISPGNSPGIQPYSAGLTLSPGGEYVWEIDSGTGTKGVDWDLVNVTGGVLDLSGLSDLAKFTLDLTTLTAGGSSGPMENYVAGESYTWRIFDSVSLLLPGSFGSAPYAAGTDITSLFTLDTTNWKNPVPDSANMSVRVAGDGLGIEFAVVPEPATLALIGTAAGLALLGLRRVRGRQ